MDVHCNSTSEAHNKHALTIAVNVLAIPIVILNI